MLGGRKMEKAAEKKQPEAASGLGKQILKTIFDCIKLVREKLLGNKLAKKLHFITWDRIYIVFFVLYFTYFFSKTMCLTIPVFVSRLNYIVIGLFTVLVWLKIVVLDIRKEKDILTILIPEEIGMIIASLVWTNSYYPEAVIYYVFIIGARNVDFRKIAGAAIAAGVVMNITSTLLSCFGVITDLVYVEFGDRIRHSFGIVYPTDYAAHWFFILALYFWVRRGKLKWFEISGYILISGFLYFACYAKTDVICILALAVCGLLFNADPAVKAFMKLRWVWVLSFAALGICALLICAFYDQGSGVMKFLDEHLSMVERRFYFTNKALAQHPFSLFGAIFTEKGYGGSTEHVPNEEYSFVDISYVKLYIRCGATAFLSLLALLTRFMYKRSKKGDCAVLALMTVIALNCFVAHHLVDFSYNVPLLMLFADLDAGETGKMTPEGKKKRGKEPALKKETGYGKEKVKV